MKKKLLVLGMIACLFGLTACGSTQSAKVTEDDVQATYVASSIIYQVNEIVAQGLEAEYVAYDSTYEEVFNNWKTGMEKIGGYVETNSYTVSTTGDQIVVNVDVTGDAADASGNAATANVQLVFNAEDYAIESLTVGDAAAAALPAELTSPIGIAMICAIVILLIAVIVLNNKLKNQSSGSVSSSGTGKSVDNTIAGIVKAEEGNANELVAVISAAIAAYESENGGAVVSADGVVIRSIRKVNKSRWQKA